MNSRSPNNPAQAGFTLLEVMIALAILVFIGLAIYQATIETFKLREDLAVEGDFENSIRLSMNILNRDVSLIYSPTLSVIKAAAPTTPSDTRDLQSVLSGDQGATTQFWEPATDQTGVRPSRFVGTESKMSFIAASHIRVYKDSQESDLAKVTYELKPDDAGASGSGLQVLFKTESPNVYQDDEHQDKAGANYALLHGLKKMTFAYYKRKGLDTKIEWINSWDSDKEEFKNAYPDAVKVTIEVIGKNNMVFDGTYIFRPEMPLHGLDPST